MASKLGVLGSPRISMESTCLLSMWCPVYRWRESDLGSNAEHGKSSSEAKGMTWLDGRLWSTGKPGGTAIPLQKGVAFTREQLNRHEEPCESRGSSTDP